MSLQVGSQHMVRLKFLATVGAVTGMGSYVILTLDLRSHRIEGHLGAGLATVAFWLVGIVVQTL